jgi:methyl-accepting chemotaxis protein
MSNKKRYKRKEVFSNPVVQYRIMGTFLFLTVLFIITNFFISRRLLIEISNEIMSLPLSAENSADVMVIMSQQGTTSLIQMGLFIFLAVFVLLMAGVVLSHRIGGPIHQLNKYLEDVTENKTKPRNIIFRKNDFFHKLAGNFNKFQASNKIINEKNKEK